ncbi:MAG: terminase large subunit domain-containing protein [Candidatus Hodarchaeota archaeon]
MQNRIKKDWYLDNPHLWCDDVLGPEIYQRHMRHKAKWTGFTDFQIAFMRDITDLTVPIIYAICNRGGSKTMLTAYSSCCLLDNLENYRVSVLAGSKKQASTCYKYCRDIFDIPMKEKIKGETTQTNTQLITGGGMEILTASEKSTRSERTDMIIIDEACSAKGSILRSVFGQIITATNMKIVILTTPDKLTHVAKEWWDGADKTGIIRYHWDAYKCSWLPRKNIQLLKDTVYDEATFRIEVLGLWTSRSGSVFRYEDIQKSLCNMSELPPTVEIDRFFLGIDWGDAHETVATIVGLQGSPSESNDRWYVYAVRSWKKEYVDIIMDGIIELCQIFTPKIISEQAAISAYSNRELKDRLSELGLIMKTESFTKKKHRVVSNFNSRLEKGKIKIPRQFKKTIEQLTNYSHPMVNDEIREGYQKGNDDYVDSILWANWGIHHTGGRIETVGEWNF